MKKSDLGMNEVVQEKIGKHLCRFLATNYSLYLKTQYYHWNVMGHQFKPLHELFEAQYQILFQANDDLAERIRTLGFRAPGSFSEYSALSFVKEDASGYVPTPDQMVMILAGDHKKMVRSIREVLPEIQAEGDEGTLELLVERLKWHEKAAWMLMSSVTEKAGTMSPHSAA